MQIDDLRCFWALTERQNYSKAAQDMGITPTILVNAIKLLEQRLGARLLEARGGAHEPRLTRAGEALKRLIPRFFTVQTWLRNRVRASGELSLRVALSGASAQFEAEVIRRLRGCAARSASDFSLKRTPLARQIMGIQQGEFDIGLSQVAGSDQDQGLTVEVAWREPLVAMLPRTHLLVSERKVTLSMLAFYTLIVEQDKHGDGYGGQIGGLLRVHGAAASRGLDSVRTIGEMTRTVLTGGGVGLLGNLQWSYGSLVTGMAACPVVDARTGKPLWLTTWLRYLTQVDPVLVGAIDQAKTRLASEGVSPLPRGQARRKSRGEP